MKTMKSRILSGIMAGVLAVSMAVPAFATSTTPVNTSTNITGSYEEIPIEVTVPQTGTAQINPYGLPIELASGDKIVGEQIVTHPLYVVNDGEVALAVTASVTGTAKGDLKFVASAPTDSDIYKSAFVYLQMKSSALDNSNRASNSADPADVISGYDAADASAEYAAWKQDYNADKDLVLVNEKAVEKANMVILDGKQEVSGNMEYVAGSAAMVRLAGKVTESPRDAWSDRDGFTAAVAFTFKPDFTSAAMDKATLALDSTTTTGDLKVELTGANIVSVEWESGTPAAATVAAKSTPTNGSEATVTRVAAGTSTITATVTADNGKTYTATCDVTAS